MQPEHAGRPQRPSTAVATHAGPGDALARLCQEIDAAFTVTCETAKAGPQRAFGECLRDALQRAIAAPGLLRPGQRAGHAQTYRRHLLAADPLGRYAVAALVWGPGQASPVHGHQTWCGYAVIEGTLAETLYCWDAHTQCAVETRRQPRAPGTVSYVDAGRGAIHQLGNPAGAATRAVSLHVYGVAAAQIATHVNDLIAA
jgi:predicted metal-dependent enzyme (double-stranded beta helix superfamily)